MQKKKIVLFFLELAVVGEAPCNYNNFSIWGFILFTDFEDKSLKHSLYSHFHVHFHIQYGDSAPSSS